jgi:hypothetical protein
VLHWTARARTDLKAIHGYVTKDSPLNAIAVTRDILARAAWSGTEDSADPQNYAWQFDANIGLQAYDLKVRYRYALAVSPGNISAVPLPGAAWLVGSGLLGLVASRRRRTEASAPR